MALLRDLTEALPSSHFTKKKKTCSVKISSDLFILEYSCSTSSVSIRHSNMAAIFSVHLAYGNIFAIPSIWKYRLPLLFTMPSFPIPFSTLSKYRKQIKRSAACVGSKLVIRCHPHPLWALRLYEWWSLELPLLGLKKGWSTNFIPSGGVNREAATLYPWPIDSAWLWFSADSSTS